jgi:hypothetical protein
MLPSPLSKPPGRTGIEGRVWLLLAVGVALRGVQYFLFRGFWGDEAFVLYNAGTLPVGQLVTGPLNAVPATQSAPALFMLLIRALMMAFGKAEWLMRGVPWLASMGALAAVCLVARNRLSGWGGGLAVGLLATSAACVFQSANVKPYSIDVLVAAVAVVVAWHGVDVPDHRPRCVVGLLILSAVGGWISFGGMIASGATAAAMLILWPALCRRLAVVLAGVFMLAAVGALWMVNLRHQSSPDLDHYWISGFAPWSQPWWVPLWVVKTAGSLVALIQGPAGWVLVPVAVYGVWIRDARVLVALAPVVAFVVGGVMGVYPAKATRVTLAVVPGVALACGAVMSGSNMSAWLRKGFVVCGVVGVVWGVVECTIEYVRPFNERDTGPAVRFALAHRQPGEPIVASDNTQPEVWCYMPPEVELSPPDVAVRPGWFIVSYARDKKVTRLEQVRRRFGPLIDVTNSWIGPMSAAFRFLPPPGLPATASAAAVPATLPDAAPATSVRP